jgi:hypothetical protein
MCIVTSSTPSRDTGLLLDVVVDESVVSGDVEKGRRSASADGVSTSSSSSPPPATSLRADAVNDLVEHVVTSASVRNTR